MSINCSVCFCKVQDDKKDWLEINSKNKEIKLTNILRNITKIIPVPIYFCGMGCLVKFFSKHTK